MLGTDKASDFKLNQDVIEGWLKVSRLENEDGMPKWVLSLQ